MRNVGHVSCTINLPISEDSEEYYANWSGEWAISPDTVTDIYATDESSKTWAKMSKFYAEAPGISGGIGEDEDYDWKGVHTFTRNLNQYAPISHDKHLVTQEYLEEIYALSGLSEDADYYWYGQHTFEKPLYSTDLPSLHYDFCNKSFTDKEVSDHLYVDFDSNNSITWGGSNTFEDLPVSKPSTSLEHLVIRDDLEKYLDLLEDNIEFGEPGQWASTDGFRFTWLNEGPIKATTIDVNADHIWTGQHSYSRMPRCSVTATEGLHLVNKAYVDALKDQSVENMQAVIGIPSYRSLQDLIAEDDGVLSGLVDSVVSTAGYFGEASGGAAMYTIRFGTSGSDPRVNVKVGTSYTAYLHYSDKVDIKQCGGVEGQDIAPIVEDVMVYGFHLHLSEGSYLWNSTASLYTTNSCKITGSGRDRVFIDVAGYSDASGDMLSIFGDMISMGKLRKRAYTCAIALDLPGTWESQDLAIVYDSTEYSGNPYYYEHTQGQIFTILDQYSGTVYRVSEGCQHTFQTYCDVYKMRAPSVHLEGFTVMSSAGPVLQNCISLRNCRNVTLKDLVANDVAVRENFRLANCTKGRIENCSSILLTERGGLYTSLGGGWNSIIVSDGYCKHAGAENDDWYIHHESRFTSRHVVIEDVHSEGDRLGYDVTPNSTETIIRGCVFHHGVRLAGSYLRFIANTINYNLEELEEGAEPVDIVKPALSFTQSDNLNMNISDNGFKLTGVIDNNIGSFINISRSDKSAPDIDIRCIGDVIIAGNTVDWSGVSAEGALIASTAEADSTHQSDMSEVLLMIFDNAFNVEGNSQIRHTTNHNNRLGRIAIMGNYLTQVTLDRSNITSFIEPSGSNF